ncbi:hypothetical protein [Actinomadura rupiterrae]|uniref:hypothetical protein n=1 Tax=Actinomadura rupiterrae TaxID=559627 RepID=UPI0020A252DA|nr:hypothetical protein [Actinomadura rupiterrae]MCP2337659.1 drug/metabolite transporter (DMT)-like permease [Actinomadura rupiterrae]
MQPVLPACAAQAVYVVAFVLFRSASAGMAPLSGRRPVLVMAEVSRSPRWLLGLLLLGAGFALGDTALLRLPVAASLPAFGVALALLLGIAAGRLGERPTVREWLALALTVAGMAAVSFSMAQGLTSAPARQGDPAAWQLGLVAAPSVLLPGWLFCTRDRTSQGRHARRQTGVAYGMGAGIFLGAAEAAGLGFALRLAHHTGPGIVEAVLFVVAGGLGLGLATVGLQHCRMIVLVTVTTVTAKIHLLIAATWLYAEPWPTAPVPLATRLAGALLPALAVVLFPRHEPLPPRIARHRQVRDAQSASSRSWTSQQRGEAPVQS